MDSVAKSIQNNVLAAFGGQMSRGVASAIQNASAKTGVDFAYLVQQAKVESSFDPNAKAKTSSATGLYQFIESTWMNMVEKYGDKHGLQTDGKSRREILELRKNPEVAANMAAEFANENAKFLNDHWAKGQKEIGSTELYMAHFLGAGGAAGFLNARDENPLQKAAYIFPEAARSNRNVFYDTATGRAKTLDEVYAFFDKKFEIQSGPAAQSSPPQIAAKPQKQIPAEMLLAYGVQDSGFENAVQEHDYIISSVFKKGYKSLEDIYQRPVNPYRPNPYQALVHAPIEIMMLAQLDLPTTPDIKRHN